MKAMKVLFYTFLVFWQAASSEWSYKDENWDNVNDACKDSTHAHQSPINLTKTGSNDGKQAIHVNYPDRTPLKLYNTGHSINVASADDSCTRNPTAESMADCPKALGTVQYGDKTYKALQFHFHFPSEHQVNGKLAQGEIHIVHTGVDLTDADADAHSDLLVIGILLDEGAQNKWMDDLGWATLGSLNDANDFCTVDGSANLAGLVGATQNDNDDWEVNGYYRYEGSLTTPPCTESVHWFVLDEPQTVSAGQIELFRQIEGWTNRPVQPLNDRKLWKNQLKLSPTKAFTTEESQQAARQSGLLQDSHEDDRRRLSSGEADSGSHDKGACSTDATPDIDVLIGLQEPSSVIKVTFGFAVVASIVLALL